MLTFLMVAAPLVASANALAESDWIPVQRVDREADMDLGPTITDVDFHGICTSKSSWTISSNVVCTNSDFTVTNYVNINNGAKLTLEQNSIMRMNVPSTSYSYKINVYGTLEVLNSTIRKSSTSDFYGVYVFNAGSVRYEGATLRDTYWYGTYAWGAGSVKINNTNFQNGQYYGLYVGMTSGYITNSTISGYNYYGIYANNLNSVKINNNTLQNNMYGANLYSFNGDFYDNTVISNSYYGIYFYNSNPNMANNIIKQNSQAGLYIYMTGMTIENSTIINNGQRDLWIEAGGGKTTIEAINVNFNKVGLDINAWGGGTSTLKVKWYANVSVNWLSDGSPVTDAELWIEDAMADVNPAEYITNAAGEVEWMPLTEYTQTKAGKVDRSPHWINVTAEIDGKEILNFTQLPVTKGGDNFAQLYIDDVPPPLTITSPEEGFLTNLSVVTLTGRTEKFVDQDRPVTVQIRLKSSQYEPTVDANGVFSQEITLGADGPHEITVKAFDWVMNEVGTSVTVHRDTVTPALEVLGPVDELLTNQTTVEVSGTTEVGATLTVNDDVVTVNDDGTWSTEVDLVEGENIIFIKTMDAAENWQLQDRLVKRDTIAPALIVSEPMDGMRTNDRNLRVAGLTEQFGRVLINGQPILVAGASFQTTYSMSEGENIILLDAVDSAGNHNYTTRTVYLDTVPPTLEVTEPSINNILVKTETITLEGYVDPDSKLTINRDQLDMEGQWSYEVDLREGKNKITVEAVDDVGNRVIITRTVIRDTTPPMLAIFSPEDGTITSDEGILVEGAMEPKAKLKINGEETSAPNGIFSKAVLLTEGENVITLEAFDVVGNVNTEKVTVHLDTIVNLDVDTSKDGKTTQKTDLTITGTTDSDGKVSINGEPVTVSSDGSFAHEIDLIEGNNSILVQAYDQYGNENHVEMSVVLKTPDGGGAVGQDIASKNNLWLWIVVIAIMIASVVAILVHGSVSRSKAREAEIQAQAEVQAAALKQEGPDAIYSNLYGSGQTLDPTTLTAAPAGAVGPATATATATPVEENYNITPEAHAVIERAENKVYEAEAIGKDTNAARRNLRLARQFAARGSSEKVVSYAEKAIMDVEVAEVPAPPPDENIDI